MKVKLKRKIPNLVQEHIIYDPKDFNAIYYYRIPSIISTARYEFISDIDECLKNRLIRALKKHG